MAQMDDQMLEQTAFVSLNKEGISKANFVAQIISFELNSG